MIGAMNFKRLLLLAVTTAFLIPAPVLQAGKPEDVNLAVFELVLKDGRGPTTVYAIPTVDDAMTNPHFKLLGFKWYTTANYWINPSNKYRLSTSGVVAAMMDSANTWDSQTKAAVFSYQRTTRRSAGQYDGYNVVAWGNYRSNVIAVTYIWYTTRNKQIVETDTIMNAFFAWSLRSPGKWMFRTL